MIGLDTNVLARYYIEDEDDEESARQHQAARRLIESGQPLMVCVTVVLELEWVMRGYYDFPHEDVAAVFRHLLTLPHVVVESRETLVHAISQSDAGLEFADALHHASYRGCERMASFDDRKFAGQTHGIGA